MLENTYVRGPTLARLATVSVLLEASGKPSTRFLPEGLVELTSHQKNRIILNSRSENQNN